MEIFKNVSITLNNKEKLKSKEVLDVGSNYYFIEGSEVKIIKKTSVRSFDYEDRLLSCDNTPYLNKKQTIIC